MRSSEVRTGPARGVPMSLGRLTVPPGGMGARDALGGDALSGSARQSHPGGATCGAVGGQEKARIAGEAAPSDSPAIP